jgi:hypothetical protein
MRKYSLRINLNLIVYIVSIKVIRRKVSVKFLLRMMK